MSCSLTDGRVLSNGRYRLVLTSSGTGFSAFDGLILSRWERDAVADRGGMLIYLRDLDEGKVWSAGRQPIPPESGARYRAQYRHGGLRISRNEHGIESVCDAAVSEAAPAEVRRITLRNDSGRARRIEVTTYFEVVLHYWASDAGHPGFSKLFVETGRDPETEALWARRRPRSAEERFPYLAHALHGEGEAEYETDRARFVGRGRSLARPFALQGPLSGTLGSVLDPVCSIRRVIHLEPQAEVSLTAVIAVASECDAALAAVAALRDSDAVTAVFAGAADVESRRARRFRLTRAQAERRQRLAVAMLYGDPLLTTGGPADATARSARRGTESSSTGDAADDGANAFRPPIEGAAIALHAAHGELDDDANALLVRAAGYWKDLGLAIGWVLICEDAKCNGQRACPLEILADQVRAGGVRASALRRSTAGGATIDAVDSFAKLVIEPTDLASLGADVAEVASERARRKRRASNTRASAKRPNAAAKAQASAPAVGVEPEHAQTDDLRAHNGYGGFSADGAEYRLIVDPLSDGARPPVPWTNVVANPTFGFLVSETGAGYTWSRNSRERRLTPWSNDPILDPHGEALYIADLRSKELWSPLPGPVPADAPYETSHGFGFSAWRHSSHGIEQRVTMFVPPDENVKVVRISLSALGDDACSQRAKKERREIALVFYARLVLGDLDIDGARMVTSEIDNELEAIFARSRRGAGFDDALAFAGAAAPAGATISFTADRLSFLGIDGTAAAPAALRGNEPLDGRGGADLDPCFAVRVSLSLAAGEDVECAFLLGEAPTRADAAAVLERLRKPGAIDGAHTRARDLWHGLLGAVEIETPIEALNLIANGWALYQAASCRIWGRSAFYQSGGAFGFRDQLQDSAAFVYARPEMTRAQIVLHAGHQFREGDVLHWWHPPVERGTRTRFADDLCWLAYITAFYVATTGDGSVLDEHAPFVDGPLLAPGQDEAYIGVSTTNETASVYEHCCRALDRSLTCGTHGLPLFGTGDWNDGMNRVGREGKGESVWMAFFLYDILGNFAPLCRARGDEERAARYSEYREHLRAAIENVAWDGEWYRRAYYDDGSVLGSAQNDECKIDVLVQAWAVLSGAARPDRCEAALDAVERMLVVPEPGLIRLLTPPFDRTAHDPGYIKGYVPGIRENGGQYTHAALWAVRAAAEFGQRERAARWLEMLLPLAHSSSRETADRYKVEPYAVVADVYGVEPHLGRGGWTWYTGSAAWMYRTIVESLLGLTLERGRTLVLRPRIPDRWPSYRMRYRLADGTSYAIVVENPDARAERVVAASMDGRNAAVENGAARIALAHDGGEHEVRVTLGA